MTDTELEKMADELYRRRSLGKNQYIEYLRSQIKTVPLKEWKGREFAEKTFPNIFERLQYVAAARHLNLDNAAYDANEYLKELIQLACSQGLKSELPKVQPISDDRFDKFYDACEFDRTDTYHFAKLFWRAAEARILGEKK